MTECEDSCTGEMQCFAEYTDHVGEDQIVDCEEFYEETECLDYDPEVDDECIFVECDEFNGGLPSYGEDATCYIEECGVLFCSENYECTEWTNMGDYWAMEPCQSGSDFFDFEEWFEEAHKFNRTFSAVKDYVCPEGDCSEFFDDEFFDSFRDFAADLFEDEAVADIAQAVLDDVEDILDSWGYDYDFSDVLDDLVGDEKV